MSRGPANAADPVEALSTAATTSGNDGRARQLAAHFDPTLERHLNG